MLVLSGVSDGSSRLSGMEANAAAWSSWPTEAVISCATLPGIEPVSRMSQPESSSRLASMISPARLTMAMRSANGVAAQAACAAAADLAARAIVSGSPPPAVPRISPVAGSTVSIVTGASIQPSLKIFPVQRLSSSRLPTSVPAAGSVVMLMALLSWWDGSSNRLPRRSQARVCGIGSGPRPSRRS